MLKECVPLFRGLINFNFSHLGQNIKAIALVSRKRWLIFVSHSAIKINHFDCRSCKDKTPRL